MNPQLSILTSLRRIHPRMLPVDVLFAEVRMASVNAPTHSELKQALRTLEEKEHVILVKDEDRERAKITSAGIARHEEAQS